MEFVVARQSGGVVYCFAYVIPCHQETLVSLHHLVCNCCFIICFMPWAQAGYTGYHAGHVPQLIYMLTCVRFGFTSVKAGIY